MEKIVVLTGAGIKLESGISTFRDANGLWENHDIMKSLHRKAGAKTLLWFWIFLQCAAPSTQKVKPNAGHTALVQLEEKYDVTIITQNVDNLHERAGSSHILHLHGELNKVKVPASIPYLRLAR